MVEKISRTRLITFREDIGGYIVYVFENLENTNSFDKYIMCTRFPRWETPFVNIGDIGFLKFREVEGGVDKWFDTETHEHVLYNYTGVHFLNFIPIKQSSDLIL